MMKNPLAKENMTALVLGFGVSGKAAVRYLFSLGVTVIVSEFRQSDELSAEETSLLLGMCKSYETGGHTDKYLGEIDLIFISPGIPESLDVLLQARKKKIPIFGELALVAPVLDTLVIGITGTNGKTTVTSLIGKLLKTSLREVFVGGNIGTPLFECIQREKQADAAVVEISSFQLEKAGWFRPHIAVLLNITPDHIDRHGSLQKYIEAKKKIFANQTEDDQAIICTDNLICKELADQMRNKPLTFGHSKECDSYICESEIYLLWKQQIEIYNLSGTCFDNLTGRLNCAAAILAARCAGCSQEEIVRGLENYQPLPHRLEFVDEIEGVTYCNDSKATNTGAVISALQQSRGKVVLIAGGRDKGEDYALLKSSVREKVRMLILIGEAAPLIAEVMENVADFLFADSMEEAVAMASEAAKAGDTVLLSPACASFDMFDSYGHRGQMFKDSVMNLQLNSAAQMENR